MRVATWNVNSIKVRLPQVLEWIQVQDIDILAIQELKLDQAFFPHAAFAEIGYIAYWWGQKTYNGVAIICKQSLVQNYIPKIKCGIIDPLKEQSRFIQLTLGELQLICIYAVNGESVGSEKFIYKQSWYGDLINYLASADSFVQHRPTILLGDFNIAPADLDIYDPTAWLGKILCSVEERAWLQTILDLGFDDSYRFLNPDTPGYSWYDYRSFAFRRKQGLRIDLILTNKLLRHDLKHSFVDINPRAQDRPSDHAPVVLDF